MMASVWQTPYLVISLLCFDRIVGSYVVDNSDGLGRRFDGIGGLSGGGVSYRSMIEECFRKSLLFNNNITCHVILILSLSSKRGILAFSKRM